MSSRRILQINELIRHELSSLLVTEVELPPGCIATIMDVETSKDLRYAKVWVSVLPFHFSKRVLDRLTKRAGRLQFLLNKKLSMRPLPRIRFVIDETEQRASEIETLLDDIGATD